MGQQGSCSQEGNGSSVSFSHIAADLRTRPSPKRRAGRFLPSEERGCPAYSSLNKQRRVVLQQGEGRESELLLRRLCLHAERNCNSFVRLELYLAILSLSSLIWRVGTWAAHHGEGSRLCGGTVEASVTPEMRLAFAEISGLPQLNPPRCWTDTSAQAGAQLG